MTVAPLNIDDTCSKYSCRVEARVRSPTERSGYYVPIAIDLMSNVSSSTAELKIEQAIALRDWLTTAIDALTREDEGAA